MLVNVKCPKCGGGRDVPDTITQWKCPYCMRINKVETKVELGYIEEVKREPERPVFDKPYIAKDDIGESVEEESTEEA